MFFLISLAVSLLLAIPTYGLSLVAFFLIKNWFDNKAMSVLLGAAAIALREEVSEERYHINRAAIRKVFLRFAIQTPETRQVGNGGGTLYSGVIQHPLINANRPFSVRFGYVPRQGSRNTVFVKAAPGIDHDVLSAEDLVAAAFAYGAPAPRSGNVDRSKPRTDADVKDFIVRAAGLHPAQLECPHLTYGLLGEFLERSEASTEYFPAYSGARTWVDIGEFSYAISVTVLNPSQQDASGVVLAAQIDGYAETGKAATA